MKSLRHSSTYQTCVAQHSRGQQAGGSLTQRDMGRVHGAGAVRGTEADKTAPRHRSLEGHHQIPNTSRNKASVVSTNHLGAYV